MNGKAWKAKWIWARERADGPVHFAYFRKSFRINRPGTTARILCAADSKYRIWINGHYLGFGPARGNPERPYVDRRNVVLRKGLNTLAFLVEHYPDPKNTFTFPAVEGGLWCRVEANGHAPVESDRSWKARISQAHRGLPGRLFPECFDARLEPEGWQGPAFDDREWLFALERTRTKLASPNCFLPRPIPLIIEKRLPAPRIIDAGLCCDASPNTRPDQNAISASLWRMTLQPLPKGVCAPGLKPPCPWPTGPLFMRLGPGQAVYLVLDFGMETLAATEIQARGPAGTTLDVGYSECLWNNRVATMWQSPYHCQGERIVLREGRTVHRFNQPRGFRYLLMRISHPYPIQHAVTIDSVAAHEAIYPARKRGMFTCSDSLLNRIFKLSTRTVNLCMEDAFTDCPWRERQQWVGDIQPEALFGYYAFGTYELARKAILELAGSVTPEGWIPGVAPTVLPKNLPTWGMRVPVIVWEYYMFSGDRQTTGIAYGAVRKQMNWFARYANKDGLVVGMPGWNVVDWTRIDDRHADGAVQGWYLEALECSSKLAHTLGDASAAMDDSRRAARLRRSLARLYWSPAKRAFRKYRTGSPDALPGTDPELIGQHENFLFALLKVGTATQRRQALDALRGVTGRYLPSLGDYQSAFLPDHKGNFIGEDTMRIASPFWSFYALLALMEAGRVQAALEYIRLCWGLMLESGSTSCWEIWDRHTSLCHGWSAAPAMILPAYILGVRPMAPGFRRFEVRPRLGDLTWTHGRVPTPSGTIHLAWHRTGKIWRGKISVPPGTSGRVAWDARANGKAMAIDIDGRCCRNMRRLLLTAGKHAITVHMP